MQPAAANPPFAGVGSPRTPTTAPRGRALPTNGRLGSTCSKPLAKQRAYTSAKADGSAAACFVASIRPSAVMTFPKAGTCTCVDPKIARGRPQLTSIGASTKLPTQ